MGEEKEKEKKVEKVETSQPGSATSNRSAGKKSTGYEYVIPPAALAITSLNNSIKSFEEAIDQERGISAKSVEVLDENGFPSSPPPAYSYLEPESESPMPAGIPFQEAPPESRIASATSILPTASRLVSAKSGLESVPGSRAASAISTRTGPPLNSGSRLGSALYEGSRVSSARSELGGSRLGSALSTRPASVVAGSPDPVYSSPATPGPGQTGATPGPPTISSLIGTPKSGTPYFDTPNMEAPQIPEPSKVESIADIVMTRW